MPAIEGAVAPASGWRSDGGITPGPQLESASAPARRPACSAALESGS